MGSGKTSPSTEGSAERRAWTYCKSLSVTSAHGSVLLIKLALVVSYGVHACIAIGGGVVQPGQHMFPQFDPAVPHPHRCPHG